MRFSHRVPSVRRIQLETRKNLFYRIPFWSSRTGFSFIGITKRFVQSSVVHEVAESNPSVMTISPVHRKSLFNTTDGYRLYRWQPTWVSTSLITRSEPFLAPSAALPDPDKEDVSQSTPHNSLMDRCVAVTAALGLSALPLGWMYAAVVFGTFTALLASAYLAPTTDIPHVKVAMIGNSMMYYNDFPRFMGTS
jgi:hypothetical protein